MRPNTAVWCSSSNDELHYEVVVNPGGQQLQVWLGDAHRRPLAASEVTDLVAEIGHPDKHVEPVDMKISNDGNYWFGAVHLRIRMTLFGSASPIT